MVFKPEDPLNIDVEGFFNTLVDGLNFMKDQFNNVFLTFGFDPVIYGEFTWNQEKAQAELPITLTGTAAGRVGWSGVLIASLSVAAQLLKWIFAIEFTWFVVKPVVEGAGSGNLGTLFLVGVVGYAAITYFGRRR
jgi:hypothetical protein